MDKLSQALAKNEKYAYLKLLDVVYDRGQNSCSVTFLYPYNHAEPTKEERQELDEFVKGFLALNAPIRLKFKKSFLDDHLVRMELNNFFEREHKSIYPYITENNIVVTRQDFVIDVDISLNKDVLSLVAGETIKNNLKKYLESKFIASFNIEFHENAENLPLDIEYVDIPASQNAIQRYAVTVTDNFIGGNIIPKPEFIRNIDKPKISVILAGTVSNIAKKTFTIKKGKHEGEQKNFYTFNLTDDKTVECVYFCPKANEKKMDTLKDGTMLLCLGDVQRGLGGKLNYMIKKMSYATHYEQKEETPQSVANLAQVVFPEPMPVPEQSNLFAQKPRFNEFITNNTIVVFDIETTGLDFETCEITEIGAVKIVNGVVKDKFSSFLRIKGRIPEEVVEKTHITNEMVMNAPPPENVINDFYNYTRGCILSGYNIIGFDMKFIKRYASKCGLKFDNEIIDAYIVARQAGIQSGNLKLGSVVKALGLSLTDAHRAFNDAYATGLVLLELNKVKN